MIKKIKSVQVGEPFQAGQNTLYPVTITFDDGTQGYASATTNPPWYADSGTEVEVILKGGQTKHTPPLDKLSIKKVEEGGYSGGQRGAQRQQGKGGGSRGGNESFALSYAKDLAVALINQGVLKDMESALEDVSTAYTAMLPMLNEAQKAPAEDPKWSAIMAAVESSKLQGDLKKLGWKRSQIVEQWDKDEGNADGFAMSIRAAANPKPKEDDIPMDFDDDDVPF